MPGQRMNLTKSQQATGPTGAITAPLSAATLAFYAMVEQWEGIVLDPGFPGTTNYLNAGPGDDFSSRTYTDIDAFQVLDIHEQTRFMTGLTGKHPIIVTDDISGKPVFCFGAGGLLTNILSSSVNGDIERPSIMVNGVEQNRLPLIIPGVGASGMGAVRIPKRGALAACSITGNVMTIVSTVQSGSTWAPNQHLFTSSGGVLTPLLGTGGGARTVTGLASGTANTVGATYNVSAGPDVAQTSIAAGFTPNNIPCTDVTGGALFGGCADGTTGMSISFGYTNGFLTIRTNGASVGAVDAVDHRASAWTTFCWVYDPTTGTISFWLGSADATPIVSATGQPDFSSDAGAVLPRIGAYGATAAANRFVAFLALLSYFQGTGLANRDNRVAAFAILNERITAS